MSYNKSSAAYDFSRFAPEEAPEFRQVPDKKVRTAVKKKSVKKQAVKPITVLKWVFVSIFVLISLGSIMVGNIKITQLNDQIAKVEKDLDAAKSTQVSLNSKLESRMSMSNVEDYATNKLGLVKTQSYQIQYVKLTNEDRVQILGKSDDIGTAFQNIMNMIEEYFS